jgi:hypothetical protein
MEWNETEQRRSRKPVIDLLSLLMTRNPDTCEADSSRQDILGSLVSIISGKSTRPLVKSAITVLDTLFIKQIFTLGEIATCYRAFKQPSAPYDIALWRSFLGELFEWMKIHHTCPPAGKLIADIYSAFRQQESLSSPNTGSNRLTLALWGQWLLEVVSADLNLLEPIKTYVFLPIFKADRQDSIEFLRHMIQVRHKVDGTSEEPDIAAMLQLAALEAGKMMGLVEEPGELSLS